MIKQKSECDRCYSKDICALASLSIEDGAQKGSYDLF